MKKLYGAKIAWLKQKSRPCRTDNWVWDDKSYSQSLLQESISSVLEFVKTNLAKYKTSDQDIHTSFTIGDGWNASEQSDIVVYVIARVQNAPNSANWMLVEASELIALIESVKIRKETK